MRSYLFTRGYEGDSVDTLCTFEPQAVAKEVWDTLMIYIADTSAMTTWGVYICTTSGGVRIFMYWSSFLNENRIDVKHFNSDSVPIDSPCNIDFRAF